MPFALVVYIQKICNMYILYSSSRDGFMVSFFFLSTSTWEYDPVGQVYLCNRVEVKIQNRCLMDLNGSCF